MNNIPATPREWQRQIEFYEWLKTNAPEVHVPVMTQIENRPERAR